MLNSRLRNVADKPNFDPAPPLIAFDFLGESEIDSAHSMPPVTSRYSTQVLLVGLRVPYRSMKFS